MIRRPNVRARVYQPNLQARCPVNRKYYPRHDPYDKKGWIAAKRCNWCKRPRNFLPDGSYPRLCDQCSKWLRRFEWSATILIDEPGNYEIKRILAGYRSDDDDA